MEPAGVVIIEALEATDVDLAREACPVAFLRAPATVWNPLAGTDTTNRAGVACQLIVMLQSIWLCCRGVGALGSTRRATRGTGGATAT